MGEFEVRLAKLRELQKMGKDPFYAEFRPTHACAEVRQRWNYLEPGQETEDEVKVAGRILTIRDIGGIIFFHILDITGKLQCAVQKRNGELIEFFRKFADIGDVVGVEGKVFRTKRGEVTVLAQKVEFLAKSLHPLPEKWHGIQDVEFKLRRRELDLIANERSREVFLARSRMVQLIRQFMTERGFFEVETPMLHVIPGGAFARPFKTYHNELELELFLRIAPELFLKRLVVGGFTKVFEIGRNFRNEGVSSRHNPEFTMMEFYWAYASLEDLINLTEELITYLARSINGREILRWSDGEAYLEIKTPFRRISMPAEVSRKLGVSEDKLRDAKFLAKILREAGVEFEEGADWGEMVSEYFENFVLPDFAFEPVFVLDWPVSVSPLARRKKDDPDITERFELYVFGMEVANAFAELSDPIDQRRRFEKQLEERRKYFEKLGIKVEIDEDFLNALEFGMPPTAGEGIGIDRLAMIITGATTIKDVILFPTLKPKKGK